MTLRRRRWVLAPIAAGSFEDRDDRTTRPTTPADDRRLARLLDDAYLGTIDYDDVADHVAELETWRKIDGADDEASRLAIADGEVVGACLVGRELGAPFLYEIAVINKLRRHGLAWALLDQALSALAVRGEPHIAARVTDGNTASEALLSSAGFVQVTPAVEPAEALGYYRAAGAVRSIRPDPDVPLAVTVDELGTSRFCSGRARNPKTLRPKGNESIANELPRRPSTGMTGWDNTNMTRCGGPELTNGEGDKFVAARSPRRRWR